MADLIAELRRIVGDKYCLSGADDRAKYDQDITGTHKGRSRAVVRPATASEVAAVLKLAHETKTPVVPLSGNTGLAGGGGIDDADNTIILSTDRMTKILSINPKSRIARVEAGVILADLHSAADAHDLVFPLVFGARGSCRIGGNLSTNAGGSNVVRYGNTRALCLGLEVVTPTGGIVNLMNELHKDNTGYDLKDLFIGAEGTLGVITKAVLKLSPKPKAYATAMVAVPTMEAALTLLHRVQAETTNAVEAFEYMPKNYFHHLQVVFPDAPKPFATPADIGILIEVAATSEKEAALQDDGSTPLLNRMTEVLGEMLESGLVLDATLAQSEQQRAEMWRQREAAFEVSTYRGFPISMDIAVPLDQVGPFLALAEARVRKRLPKADIVEIAHLGDGNLHYSLWPDPEHTGAIPHELAEEIYEMVEEVVQDLGGSFSAEHGIGTHKLSSMARRKDKGALEVMRAIKMALDPNNIMNPGKVIPAAD